MKILLLIMFTIILVHSIKLVMMVGVMSFLIGFIGSVGSSSAIVLMLKQEYRERFCA